eukprot:TRINITY_DN7682_c0_g1_i1.p1 TRINITY_DN7682_c0_g1~~TRINITY_DN7682_c0_g1_i1.p1  ORF type:complete len:607 (+),score=112.17 TRINITY_DN7682_c0_g1_i1:46-1866(+)
MIGIPSDETLLPTLGPIMPSSLHLTKKKIRRNLAALISMRRVVHLLLVLFSVANALKHGLPLNEINEMENLATQRINHFKQNKPSYTTTNNLEGWAAFEDIVRSTLNCPQAPRAGISVAVFKGNEVLYSNGFGYADIQNAIPITPDTLLAIGSVSKGFTSTILASLADQGKFDWTADVRTYLPNLQFPPSSQFSSQTITTIDLLAHRLGLPYAGDTMWISEAITSIPETGNGLQYLSPTTAFRSKVQYNNIAVDVGGYIGMLVENLTWPEITQRLIFDKLGMKDSYGTWKEVFEAGLLNKGYAVDGDSLRELSPYSQRCVDGVGPAGSIYCTLEDLMRWVRFHLAGGKNEQGEQVIHKDFLDEIYVPREIFVRPQYTIENGPAPFSFSLSESGMGWFNGFFNGKKFLWHNGGLSGANSFAIFIPYENLGMVYLTNTNTGALDYFSVMIAGLETALYGYTHVTPSNACFFPCPWQPQCFERPKEEKKEPPVRIVTNITLQLKDYVSVYTNPAFGDVSVSLSDKGGLQFTYASVQCQTSLQILDIFEGTCTAPAFLKPIETRFSFRRNFNSDVDEVIIPLWDAQPISFTNNNYQPAFWTYPRLQPELV